MKIGGINEAGRMSQAAACGGQEDAYTKNIKNQIAQAQKEMQQLSSNQELNMEDKMKKRQELTRKISDLNNQLRQHEIEQRREKQQQMAAEKETSDPKSQERLSKESMQNMISADSSIKQAQVQGKAAAKIKGEASILKSEIKQDAGRGSSVEAKQEELAKLNKRAAAAEGEQLKQLGEANKSVKESSKDSVVKDESDEKEKEESEEKEQKEYPDGYVPVDVRL